MRVIVDSILKGKHPYIDIGTFNVDIKDEVKLDMNNVPSGDPILIIGKTNENVFDFFERLNDDIETRYYELIECKADSFTLRHHSYEYGYRQETYSFAEKALANRVVKECFDCFITKAKKYFPDYESKAKEEKYATVLAEVAYGIRSLDIKDMTSLAEFKEFYENNRKVVEKELKRRMQEKHYPYWLDTMVRVLFLIIINLLFFLEVRMPLLLVIDVALAMVESLGSTKIQEKVVETKLRRKVSKNAAIKEWIFLNEGENLTKTSSKCVGISTKIAKAIKADIRILEQMSYSGYKDDLNALYFLADNYFKSLRKKLTEQDELLLMRETLAQLIDIERNICIEMNYYDELNAEVLLREVESGTLDETTEVLFDMEDRAKKLVY